MPAWVYVTRRSARRARLEGRNARPQLIRLALEQGGEKAVGAVPGGCEAQVILAGGAMAPDNLFPGPRGGIEREIGGGGEKRLGLVLVLLAQQGAGGVDEPAAGFYQARGAGQDVALADHQLGEVVRGGAPLPVGIAAPAADPETGRVDEHKVEAAVLPFRSVALDPEIALGRERPALDIADPGAAQADAGALQAPSGGIAGDELAAVLHLRGEREGLAAGAGAEIDDPHARPRTGEQGGQLRALVLHLDEAVPEGGGGGRGHPVLEAQP